jgi:hypothetical protein
MLPASRVSELRVALGIRAVTSPLNVEPRLQSRSGRIVKKRSCELLVPTGVLRLNGVQGFAEHRMWFGLRTE